MTTKTKVRKNNSVPARERILAKAEELFYRQGYQATGINQLIGESGVAKATFYAHFPSKDDLCLAYLKESSEREMNQLEGEVKKRKTPLSRFLCLIEMLEPWLVENKLKGCGFLNIVPEVTDPQSPLRKAGVKHYRGFEVLQKRLAGELIDSDPKKYRHLGAEKLADDYILLMTGALALVEIYHDIKPMRYAIKRVREMVR